MISVLKSHLPVEGKNLPVHTVKTVPALLVYLPKVKPRNLALTVFAVIPLKKVAMRVNLARNQNMEKALVLETLTPIHHVVFDVVNNKK